jgi:hypothetical protein
MRICGRALPDPPAEKGPADSDGEGPKKSDFDRKIFEQLKLGSNTNEPLGPLAGPSPRKPKTQN